MNALDDAIHFIVAQTKKEENEDNNDAILHDFFANSLALLDRNHGAKKKDCRILNDKVVSGLGTSISNYIQELATRTVLDELCLNSPICNQLFDLLNTRTDRLDEEPNYLYMRLHGKIESHLLALHVFCRGDELLHVPVDHPDALRRLDYYTTAYEASKSSGDIIVQAQCASRAGLSYDRMNLKEEANKYYSLCLGHCAPTAANSLRYSDNSLRYSDTFDKVKVLLYKEEWFQDALKGKAGVSTEIWLAAETLQAQVLADAEIITAEKIEQIHLHAMGTPVIGGINLVTFIFNEHPPRGQDQEKTDYIVKTLSEFRGRATMVQLRSVLKPMKLLYHPDKNLGLDSTVGQDIAWKLLCIEISMALNQFNTPAENAEIAKAHRKSASKKSG